MPQWKARSLLILVVVFIVFLLCFNAGSFLLGKTVTSFPFTPIDRGYAIRVSNLTFFNLPVSIESYPLIKNSSYLSVWCGDEAEVNDQRISLSEEHFLSFFSLCDSVTIEIWPRHNGVGFWLRSHFRLHSGLIFAVRFVFILIISASFYFLFKSGRHLTVMRSTLITEASIILILDPLQLLSSVIPSVCSIHQIVSCVGWWRAAVEVFAEYGPLVKHRGSVYKYFASVPAFILFLVTFSERLSAFAYAKASAYLGVIGGCFLPFAGVWFLSKAGNTTGRLALTVHVVSGVLALEVCYFMKYLRNTNEDFKDSLLCETAEVSFVGCYAMFQTIFQAGEGQDEAPKNSSSPKLQTIQSIEESLSLLADIENETIFADDHIQKN